MMMRRMRLQLSIYCMYPKHRRTVSLLGFCIKSSEGRLGKKEMGDFRCRWRPPCQLAASPVASEDSRALMRYSAKLMLAWEPVIVTCRSVEPSTGLAILI